MKIANAIAGLVKDYMQEYPGECRVAVPGLTDGIARSIHEELLSDDITSYLVVGETQRPDPERKWILPNSLTSFRVGSFVAVTAPGQFAKLQEGIYGAGGVIRSLAFGEEFPFESEGGHFNFNRILDQVLPAWLPEDEAHQEWLRHLIVEGLIPACRQISADKRPEYLLEKLIDEFDPGLNPELTDVRERFLLHCGIPGPIAGDDASTFCESIRKLCIGVLSEMENGARDLAKDNVDGLGGLTDDQKRQLKSDIDSFLDGVGATGDVIIHAGEVLSLSGGWWNLIDPSDACRLWRQLDRDTLRALFQVHEAQQGTDLRIEALDPGDDGLSSGMHMAIFDGATIEVQCGYDTGLTQSEFDDGGDVWEIKVKHRATELDSWECDSPRGQHTFTVDTSSITGSKANRLPLKVQMLHGDNEERAKNFYIHICGVERPKLAVIHDSPFEVIELLETENASTVDDLNAAFHVSVMLDQASSEQPLIELDEEQLELSESPLSARIFRTRTPVDPSQFSASSAELAIDHEGDSANITLSPGDLEAGEYTLEDELRVAITASSRVKRAKLLRIFAGESNDTYPLGNLNEYTRRLNKIATKMTAEDGWPVVANLLSTELEPIETAKPVIYLGKDTPQLSWLEDEVSSELKPLVEEYCEARNSLITFLEAQVDELDSHPLYAYAPIFIANKQGEIEELLRRYLKAYNDILGNLHQKVEGSELSRSDAFILSSLDRVVHKGTAGDGEFFLLGPWHPVVVARRYMAQRALYLAGKRYERDTQGFKFNVLAGLLANVSGLYWGSCLKEDDVSFEGAALSGVGDPGWLAGMSKGFMNGGHLQEFLAGLKAVTSLDLSLYSLGGNHFSSNCIKRFMRAFPERRRAGFYILPGYSAEQLIDSAIETIHKNGDSAADYSLNGKRVPGGIHFFLEEKPNEDGRLPNTGENVFLYHYPAEKKQECIEKHYPDVIVHPNSYRQSLESPVPQGAKSSLCRGKAKESFLIAAPSRLKVGGEQVDSLTFVSEAKQETSEPTKLGELFQTVAFNLGNLSGQPVCISKDNALPMGELSAPWLYLPSAVSDPAALVAFVEQPGGNGDSRSLWDYKHDITRRSHESYYTLSRIPASLDSTLRECLGDDIGDPNSLITDLGKSGIAIGGESLKTTNAAKGAVGLAAAVRLFCGWEGGPDGILENGANTFGFVLPVDSFDSILGNKVEYDESGQTHLSDLLAVQLQVPENNSGDLIIRAISVEAKFRKKSVDPGGSEVNEWFSQAKETYQRFKSLTQVAKGEDGIPERLGLLELLRFGVRLNYENGPDWLNKEKAFLGAMLEGRFHLEEGEINTALITTEKSMSGDPEYRDRKGRWIRLNPGHWPGVNDTEKLMETMEKLRELTSVNTGESPDQGDNNGESGNGEGEAPGPVVDQPIPGSDEAEVSEEQPSGQGETNLQPFIIGTSKEDSAPVYLDFDGVGEGRNRLDTRNLYITGSSGKGKTALLKTIISSVREQGANVLMMDIKGKDFCGDTEFRRNFEVSWCRHDGLPFNPLIPSPIVHPGTGEVYLDCRQHIQKVAAVLASTYSLQVQQKNTVQQAINACFRDSGIDPNNRNAAFNLENVPVLNEIETQLENMEGGATVLGRLGDLFTYNTFREDSRTTRFEDIIGSSWIIELSDFDDDKIKTAISKLFLVSANGYFNTQPSTGLLRLGLVFDEAHRVNDLPELENLARQARSYGVALVLASQYPDDLNDETRLCFSTKICHGHGDETEGVRKIARALNYQGDPRDLAQLDKFEAVIQNTHYDNELSCTLGWPHYLVYRHILENGPVNGADVGNIEGIDPQKLSIQELLNHMREMGLIEIINDQAHLMEGLQLE